MINPELLLAGAGLQVAIALLLHHRIRLNNRRNDARVARAGERAVITLPGDMLRPPELCANLRSSPS